MSSMLQVSGANLRIESWAVALAIVALSPVPLALPSAIGVAVIGILGAVSLLLFPVAAAPPAIAPVARPAKDDKHR